MSAALATVDVDPPAVDVPGRDQAEVVPPPAVRVVDHCQGYTWALSRAAGVVWVLSGPPAVVAERVAAALAAYDDPGPRLRGIACAEVATCDG